MADNGTKSSGTSDTRGLYLSEMAAFALSAEVAACVRLISAHYGVSMSSVYRQALSDYIAGIMSSLESAPGAGLAGQGDAELAAALRAALVR